MENVKKYKITIIITTLSTLLPILFGLIVWNRLPEQIATHWGADGQADGYSGKAFAVFGMPCILAVLQLCRIRHALYSGRTAAVCLFYHP